MPNVKLKPYTFSGTTHLERLTVGSLALSTLYEAFINTKDNDVVINRFEIKDVELLEKEFFEKAVINNLIIPETCRVGYGVYKYLNPYNYYDNGTIESIDGEVVSINAKEGKLTLDGYFNKINATKFANELGGIKELKIVGYNELVNNYELFNALKSVEVLEVDNFDVLNTDILSACRSINTLRCPVPYDRLEYYIGSYPNISNLEIYGQGHLSQYCTENLRYISSVKVSNEVSGMDERLFPQSYNIHTIDIPLVNAYAPLPHVYPTFANAINVTISAKEAHIPDKYFTEMYNISTIKVGEGIMSVGYNIVSDAPNLTSIELPDTATDMPSMPVIGANCFNLRKVEYALDSRYSTTYAEFNESYEFFFWI
jgi:hypothetical protein